MQVEIFQEKLKQPQLSKWKKYQWIQVCFTKIEKALEQ